LHNAMTMAAPAGDRIGDVRPCGRLHLAAAPACFRLADRAGQEVQFLLMPYPTPSRYLHDTPAQRYGSLEEKNRHLGDAFVTKLRQLQDDPAYRRDCPTVLSAHVHVHGVSLAGLFRMTEQESIVLGDGDLPHGMAYVALGHIHQPQALGGLPHVRYCGSIERLDLGEQRDAKGVVVFDVGPDGLQGAPRVLPLDATPIYEVDIADPAVDLPQLRDRYPDADRALVKYHLTYRTGTDNLEAILKELDGIFPRWYARDWRDANALGPTLAGPDAVTPHQGFAETVRAYLQTELVNHADDERDAVLRLAEELLAEEGA
jgi:DNA repair exonuclease SbcCD nuclease subunit